MPNARKKLQAFIKLLVGDLVVKSVFECGESRIKTALKIDRKFVKVQNTSGICRNLRLKIDIVAFPDFLAQQQHKRKKAINLIEHANWFIAK